MATVGCLDPGAGGGIRQVQDRPLQWTSPQRRFEGTGGALCPIASSNAAFTRISTLGRRNRTAATPRGRRRTTPERPRTGRGGRRHVRPGPRIRPGAPRLAADPPSAIRASTATRAEPVRSRGRGGDRLPERDPRPRGGRCRRRAAGQPDTRRDRHRVLPPAPAGSDHRDRTDHVRERRRQRPPVRDRAAGRCRRLPDQAVPPGGTGRSPGQPAAAARFGDVDTGRPRTRRVERMDLRSPEPAGAR